MRRCDFFEPPDDGRVHRPTPPTPEAQTWRLFRLAQHFGSEAERLEALRRDADAEDARIAAGNCLLWSERIEQQREQAIAEMQGPIAGLERWFARGGRS